MRVNSTVTVPSVTRGQVPLQFIFFFGFDWATLWVLDFTFTFFDFGSLML
jgi:hypothetical protein